MSEPEPPPAPTPAEAPAIAALPALAGLRSDQVTERRTRFGSNQLTEIKGRSFLAFVGRALNDRTLKILMVSAAIVVALDLWRGQSLVEGLAILVAVAVAAFVTSFNEWRAQAQFKSLQREQHDFEVRVLRDGKVRTVSAFDLVVDDVVEIGAGDKVPADGRVFNSSELTIDESTLTGESLPVPKHQDGDALARAGTLVTEGRGTLLVTAVGDRTEYGRLRAELSLEEAPTPLQERLSRFADRMSLFAVVAAVAIFLAMVLPALARGTLGQSGSIARELLNDLVLAVTIVVVAVPEGLPVAVTLSLAWSARKLSQQGCLVRRLLACETMGSVDVICTDKTGTLTFNRQRVERLRFPDGEEWSGGSALPLWSRTLLAEIASVDSTATFVENENGRTCVGSPTEGALLELVEAIGGDWRKLRTDAQFVATFGFTSERKRMTTVVRRGDGWRVLMKGAPEIVLARCSRSLARDGARPLRDGERAELQARTDAWGRSALRSVAFAYRDVPATAAAPTAELENDLVFVGLAALGDPVRPEARDAITACRSAGVEVKVVTGDGRLTAEAVARDVGLVGAGELVLEGAEFQARSDDELLELLPKLRVVARAVPSDKLRLVELLQRAGKVVAVTGDGTNDAPALRRADVGLSMGRSGTDVAREASDIVLRDDDFSAVVHALKSGRAIFDNIRKFIQFQLTVNLVALLFSFIAGLTGHGSPLTVVQLLWVNLIMDALAALALATEPPADDLLARAPKGRGAPLISSQMWVYIGVLGAFMLGEMLLGLKVGTRWSQQSASYGTLFPTLLFNAFVFLQIGNLFNARTTTFDVSALRGLLRSRGFLLLVGLIVVLQWCIVQVGGSWFGTVSLPGAYLLRAVIASLGAIVFSLLKGAFVRRVSRWLPDRWPERLAQWVTRCARAVARLPAQLAEPGSEALAWTIAGGGVLVLIGGVALRATESARHVVSYGCFAAGVLALAIVLWQQRAKFSRPGLASPRLHAWLSSILLLGLVGEVNDVASRHYGRLDLTARKDFTLSPQTTALLDRINLPIRLTTIVRRDTISNEVRDLLAEYAARGRTVETHAIDADSDPGEIERLADRLSIKRLAVDSIVVEVGDRSRVIAPDEFLRYRKVFIPKYNRSFTDRRSPPEFLGEQLITSSLISLTSREPLRVAFVVGHGERSPDDFDARGVAYLRDRLRREGCDVATLALVNGAPIPEDRQVLIEAGPTAPLEPTDLATLAAFLARGGKWLLTLSPFQTAGLGPLLKEWGVDVRPLYLADVENSTAGHEPTTLLVSHLQGHAITDAMPGATLLFPYATSVHYVPVEKKTLDGENLALTSAHGGGITDARRSPKEFDPKLDKTSPTGFSVAVAIAEPVNYNSAEGRKEPARLVVVGNTDFASNTWVDRLGNADFLVNCVDWLARREELISLRARAPDTAAISLSIGAKKALWWLVLGLLPGLAAAIGGFVAWQRRA